MNLNKNSKKLITRAAFSILLILSSIWSLLYFTSNKNQPLETKEIQLQSENTFESNGIRFYKTERKGFMISAFSKPFDFIFTPKNTESIKDQANKNNYSLAINSSYFKGTYSNAEHAGLLSIRGNLISPLGKDDQLTHIVIYNTEKNTLSFESIAKYSGTKYKIDSDKHIFFQTGPLVIENNTISKEYIDSSLNGNGKHFRTLLGYIDENETFFIVTEKTYKLEDLANEVLQQDIFKDKKINLINLDGGPSTAMYSKDFEEFRINEEMKLPLIIGVK